MGEWLEGVVQAVWLCSEMVGMLMGQSRLGSMAIYLFWQRRTRWWMFEMHMYARLHSIAADYALLSEYILLLPYSLRLSSMMQVVQKPQHRMVATHELCETEGRQQ